MPSSRFALLALGLPVLFAAGCAEQEPSPVADDARESDAPAAAKVPPDAARLLASQGSVRLIARVAPEMPPMRRLGDAGRRGAMKERSAALDKARVQMEGRLPAGALLSRSFQQVPLMVVDVSDAGALAGLAGLHGVVSWHLDERHERTLDDSLGLIGQPEAQDAGFTGAGTAVAVLDTGLDYTHADFGSCSAPGTTGCQVVAMEEVAPDDGALDDHGHGTNVAAIVGGVAPGTDLIGMDVFRSDGYAYSSDIVAAIDWVVTNQSTYNIVALNMSLGGGQYTEECSYSTYEVAMAIAKAAGVASAVATGNDGWTDSIASPACAPSAVKVGAVYARSYGRVGWSTCTDSATAADQVTCFSNSASFMDVLAPGALIDAGGYRMGGTSQATPHVAGAIAVVAEAYPSESPGDWVDRLLDTGTAVTDSRNGVTMPRIDVEAAVQDAIEGDAPTVSITLDGGAAYTNYRGVDATLQVSDGTAAATEMCLANADDGVPATCTDWTTLDEDGRWWLSSGQGEKTVAVWVRDDAGRTSDPATASIELDTIAPEDGDLTATWDADAVALSWDDATDSRSGVSGYLVVHAAGTTAPSDCDGGTVVYEGTATSTTVSALSSADAHAFRVCAVDAAGNASVGATDGVEAAGTLEGTVTINDGDEYTAERAVTLALEADGAAEMCLSNTPRCAESSWRAFESELTWYVPNVEGDHTVSVWFRSASGTESEVATADIHADFSAPVVGTARATASPRPGRVRVSWAGFFDEGSGLDHYRVVPFRARSGEPSCDDAEVLVDPDATGTTVAFDLRGPLARVGVCAVDQAGNASPLAVTSIW